MVILLGENMMSLRKMVILSGGKHGFKSGKFVILLGLKNKENPDFKKKKWTLQGNIFTWEKY